MHILLSAFADLQQSLSKVLGKNTVTCTQSDILCGWTELLFLICHFLLCGLCQTPPDCTLLSVSLVWNNTHRVQQNYIKDQLKRKTSSATSNSAWLGEGCQNKGSVEWCFPQCALLYPSNLRFRDFKNWKIHHVRRPNFLTHVQCLQLNELH